MNVMAPVASAVLLVACGARTSLHERDGGTGLEGGGGPGGGASTGSDASSTGGGVAACVPETFGRPGTTGGVRVELDGDHVYWAYDFGVARALLGGGEVEDLAAVGGPMGDLVLDGDRVLVGAHGDLLAIPREGGAPEVLAAATGSIVSLAVDDDAIYWMAGGDGIFAYTLERLGRDGSRSVLLGPIDFGRSIALAGDDVVFTATALPDVDALGVIARIPRTGGPVTVVASSRREPTNIFARGDALYWTEQYDALDRPVGVVRLRPGDPSPEVVLAAPPDALPVWSAATETTVVMTALGGAGPSSTLYGAPLDGGPTTVLAEDDGIFLETAASADRVAMTVRPSLEDFEAGLAQEVRVVCP